MPNYEITKSEEIFLSVSAAEDEFLKCKSQRMFPPLLSPHPLPKKRGGGEGFKFSAQKESECKGDEVNRRGSNTEYHL